ncbi:MAG: STAS domain-containing protein, partial [Pseudomonadota bacterium]
SVDAPARPERPELKDLGQGRFALHGDMSFATVSELLDSSEELFEDHTELDVDLAGVTRTDSAGLALLLEWINWANHSVREIRFRNIPDKIRRIARATEVEDLLHIGERWTGFIEPTIVDEEHKGNGRGR